MRKLSEIPANWARSIKDCAKYLSRAVPALADAYFYKSIKPYLLITPKTTNRRNLEELKVQKTNR